ncbi:uncharacterized protein LOC143297472 [Babylonia areolata]|uniref:uncharacterized protein LOC143297472 n=1 Tax=Babylonia areolata TaxID=304850 RepID=UPI003FCF72DC
MGAVPPDTYDHLIEMIIGKDSHLIDGLKKNDVGEVIFFHNAESTSLLAVAPSTTACQNKEATGDVGETFVKGATHQLAVATSTAACQNDKSAGKSDAVHRLPATDAYACTGVTGSLEEPSFCTLPSSGAVPADGTSYIVVDTVNVEMPPVVAESVQCPDRPVTPLPSSPLHCSSATKKRRAESKRMEVNKRRKLNDSAERSAITEYYQMQIEKEKGAEEREIRKEEREAERQRQREEREAERERQREEREAERERQREEREVERERQREEREVERERQREERANDRHHQLMEMGARILAACTEILKQNVLK